MSEMRLPNTSYRFETLPEGVKFVRMLPGGKDDRAMVECSHPTGAMRWTMTSGPRAGNEICLLCKTTDFSRSVLTTVEVAWKDGKPPVAEEPSEPEPEQVSLF